MIQMGFLLPAGSMGMQSMCSKMHFGTGIRGYGSPSGKGMHKS